MAKKETMFGGKPKSKYLARVISITSPTAFRKSIRTLKEDGLTVKEKRGLTLAQNRAVAQLKRKDLSSKERKEMGAIGKIKIPPSIHKSGGLTY